MSGAELIAAERQRQIAVEGWTAEHDDEHCMGEMIGAAVTYAAHALEIVSDGEVPGADNEGWWPWEDACFKPSPEPTRNLVKAGALIAAEIDRLQRGKETVRVKNYEPRGTRFYAEGKEMMLVQDDEPRKEMHCWLLYRHPDGQWVTLRKATDADVATISAALVRSHHSD